MKKTAKRVLSVFLTLIMLLSCFSVGLVASATITTTNHNPVYIVVPETIYMTPSTGDSTTAKYYINNTFNSSNNTISPDANASATSAKVYFKCADATALSVSVNGSGREYTITMNGDGNGYFDNEKVTALNGVQIDNGVAAGNTSYITWTFTATIGGKTETFKAYTELYAPYTAPVAALARNLTTAGGEPNIESLSWISGIHSVDAYGKDVDNSINKNNGVVLRKVNRAKLAPILGVVSSAAAGAREFCSEDSGSDPLFNDNTAVYYTFDNSKSNQKIVVNSPTGHLTVDRSRNDNLSQIPNMNVGHLISYYGRNYNKGDTYRYLTVDWTTRQETFYNHSNWGAYDASSWNDVETNLETLPRLGGNNYSAWQNSLLSTRIIYNSTWSKDISELSSGEKVYAINGYAAASAKNYNTGRADNYCISRLRVTAVNKSALRTAIQNAINGGYQESWYSSASAFKTNYSDKLLSASRTLGNPMATDTQIANAKTAADEAKTWAANNNNLKKFTAQAGHFGVIRVLDSTGTTTGYKVATTLDSESKAPTIDQKTDFSKNTYNNYTYKGYAAATGNELNSTMTDFGALNSAESISGSLRTTANASYSFFYQAKDITVSVLPGGYVDSDGNFYPGTWNGKTGTTTFQASVGSTFKPAAPERDCYTFTGWNVVGATTNADGSITFTDSNATLTATWEANPNATHNWQLTDTIREPSCILAGEDEQKCTLCGATRTVTGDPATGVHTKAPGDSYTPIEIGGVRHHRFTCNQCNQPIEEPCDIITVTTPPTCVDAGTTVQYCPKCLWSDTTDIKDPTGHTYVFTVTSPATADAAGEMTVACQNCDKISDTVAIPVHTHTFDKNSDGTVTKQPTCFDKGEKVVACSNNGTSYTFNYDGKEYTVESAYAACSATGTVEVPATGNHTPAAEWTLVPSGDCTKPGTKYHTCTTPGCIEHLDVTEIPAVEGGHVFDASCVTFESPANNDATCTSSGFRMVYCKYHNDPNYKCDGHDGLILPALGHDYENVDYVLSYTSGEEFVQGQTYTHSQTCKRCGVTETVACHDFVTVNIPATCTTDAYEIYTCSECLGKYKVTEVGSAINHANKTLTSSTPATCTTAGQNVYHCPDCGENIEETIAIDENAHSWGGWTSNGSGETDTHTRTCQYSNTHIQTVKHEWDNGKVTGSAEICGQHATVTYTCKVCGVTRTEEGKELQHDYGEWIIDTPATCVAAGSRHRDCQRENCPDKTQTEVIAINPKAHDRIIDAAVEPTCQSTGKTAGYHCSRCDNDTLAQEVVPMKPHTSEVIPAVAATCTKTGLTAGVKCSVCQTVTTPPTETPALGHIEVIDAAVLPTCTVAGKTEGKHCSRCGDILVAQQEVPATGHKPVAIEEKAATCTENGSKGGTMCDVCKVVIDPAEILPAFGHEFKYLTGPDNVEPTCETDGKRYYACVHGCGEIKVETLPALGHKWGELIVVSSPTCSERGVAEKNCSVCDAKQTIYLAVTNHIYSETVVAPTCTTDGYVNHICILCGHSYIDSVVTAPGHDYDVVVTPATCETEGLTTYTCKICGNTMVNDIVPAFGHNYVETTVGATCDTEGYTEFRCTTCGKSYKGDVIAALGHDFVESVIEPGCTTTGYTLYACSRCGLSFRDNITAAVGHNYKEIDRVGATATKSGYILYSCLSCGSQYQEIIYTGGKALICETLRDENGMPMPNAQVVATNAATGETITFTTDANGYFTYVFPEGKWELKIHKDFYEDSTGLIIVENGSAEVTLPKLTTAVCDCLCHQTSFWARLFRVLAKFLALFGNKIQCCDCCALWD